MNPPKTISKIQTELQEFATMLVQTDADIAEEVLLAREQVDKAVETEPQAEKHIANAIKQLRLAKKIDKINKNHQETIQQHITSLEEHKNK